MLLGSTHVLVDYLHKNTEIIIDLSYSWINKCQTLATAPLFTGVFMLRYCDPPCCSKSSTVTGLHLNEKTKLVPVPGFFVTTRAQIQNYLLAQMMENTKI